jgi:hypothetical protein
MKAIALTAVVMLVGSCVARSTGTDPASGPGPSQSVTGSGPAAGVPAADPINAVHSTPMDVVDPVGAIDPVGPSARGLVVHEWGTFTSVDSSTGVLMEGLHHEEEPLPAFVHGRGAVAGSPVAPGGMKSMETQPVGVTQKMETPVLYFYGGAPTGVRVRVDFPAGVVSEWYPNAASFGPALGTVSVPSAGFIEWRGELAPAATAADFPVVSADDIWAPSRNVPSVPLAVGAEREQFIFYRGLGAFELPMTITVDASDRITIQNRSADASPAVFLLRVHPGGGAIIPLGSLAGGGVIPNIPSPISGKEHDLDIYVADARAQIAQALEGTGLTQEESQAMVDTWSKSYFQSEGLRVLYVVPRAWTDQLLPLTIEPTPVSLVRTLVGRVELLAPSEENALLATVTDATARALSATDVINGLGRLAEPKLRRAFELATDDGVRSWTQRAITTAAATP